MIESPPLRPLLVVLAALVLGVAPPAAGSSGDTLSPAPEPPGGSDPGPEAPAVRPSVLVLPLAALGDADPPWFSQGSAAFLSEAARSAGHRVVDPEAVTAALHRFGLQDEERLPLASALVLARELRADFLLAGSWLADGDRITASARAIDVPNLRLVRRAESAGWRGGLGALLGDLARGLIGEAAEEDLARLTATPVAALEAWMQAAGEPDVAEDHLRAALDALPGFVPARLDLAELLLDDARAEEAAPFLVGLPPGQPAHRQARARVLAGRMNLGFGDHRSAVAVLTQACATWPEADAYLWLAEALLAAGRRDEAEAAVGSALALAPEDEEARDVLRRARAPSL